MGLDGVEFVMAVEETFGLAIPDEDAQKLLTPGELVRYLEGRLRLGESACLEQRAFYRLRQAGIAVLNLPRSAFRPDTKWNAILASPRRRRSWQLLRHAVGGVAWPTMWPWDSNSPRHATIADTARYLATNAAATLRQSGGGWSRSQIEAIIKRLMADRLGIEEFDWNQRFVDDLGVD